MSDRLRVDFDALAEETFDSAHAADSETFTTTVQNVVPRVALTGRRPPLHFGARAVPLRFVPA